MPGKQERLTRSKKAQSLSQPSSRASSPVPGPSAEQPPVVHGSNPEVRQAVLVMDREMTLFTEILEKIEALSRDLKDVKAQTHQDGQIARLRRQLEEKERELEEERRRNQARSSSYQHLSFLGENMGHTVIYPNLFHVADHLRQNVYHENMFQVMRVLLHFANLHLGDPPYPWGQPKMCPMSSRGNPSLTSRGYVSIKPLEEKEIEGWVCSIENLVKPPTSEAFIQAARANCRGPADLIINSPLFDYMQDWDTFKTALRTKFRGTYTAADFYKVLYENKMSAGQAPMDFYQQLEGSVYQGYRDHKEAIGDPSELIRRVFLSGIPPWLRDFLALKKTAPSRLAEAENSRNGIRHRESTTRHQSPNDLPVGDHLERRHYPDRPPRVTVLLSCFN
ncbi:hypothetical protein C7M84_008092 [Penaeus vannamei]|uniref:Retrotransposon gag domain-containing protein n=1 Tax=Penaeus vannamei TaxID=6689 RepID=A0A423TAJ3_PENVA|nr:hypothetical protein C7M84_008092 [Penaeus vannamei]